MPRSRIGWIGFGNSGSAVGALELSGSIIEALGRQGKVNHENAEYFLTVLDNSVIRTWSFTRPMDRFCYELAGSLVLPGGLTDPATATFKVRKAWLEFYSGWIKEDSYRIKILEAKFWREPNGLKDGCFDCFKTLLSSKRSERVIQLLEVVSRELHEVNTLHNVIDRSVIEQTFVMIASAYIPCFPKNLVK